MERAKTAGACASRQCAVPSADVRGRAGLRAGVLVLMMPGALAAAAVPPLLLGLAEQPAGLVRQAEQGQATAGTRLQDGDMLEIAAGSMAQVEAADDCLIALRGPAHLIMDDAQAGPAGPVQLRVLDGWVKVQPYGGAASPQVTIDTPGARVVWRGGAAVLHVEEGRMEVFAESAELQVAALDGGRSAGADSVVAREHFAVREGTQAIVVKARPDPAFVQATPLALRDVLEPFGPRLRGQASAPVLQPVAYAQVERWLVASPTLRHGLVTRFQPRLRDGVFRTAVEAHLTRLPDWRDALHPVRRAAAAGAAHEDARVQGAGGKSAGKGAAAEGTLPHSVIYLSPTDTPAYGLPANAGGEGRR